MFTILGSIFGFSSAYLTGKIEKSTQTLNPFIEAGLYYNNSLLEQNTITGSIDASGNVSISVGGNSLTASGSTFSLPLYVKNIGNIDAYLYSITAQIDFYDGEDYAPISNESGEDTYHLTLVTPNTYTLEYNSFYSFTGDISLTKNAGTSSQILSSIIVGNDIANSQLCGKTFEIHFFLDVGQEGLEDL